MGILLDTAIALFRCVQAVQFHPEAAAADVANRFAAVVVSLVVSARGIATRLSASLDAVFLPRPLVLFDRIPPGAVGRASRAKLLEIFRRSIE